MVRLYNVFLERRDDVSRGRNNDVPSVRLHDVSELCFRDILSVGLYYVFKLRCHDLHLVGFHVSFVSNQTPNFSSTNQEGNKSRSLDYKLLELLLQLKTAYTSTIIVIFIR